MKRILGFVAGVSILLLTYSLHWTVERPELCNVQFTHVGFEVLADITLFIIWIFMGFALADYIINGD